MSDKQKTSGDSAPARFPSPADRAKRADLLRLLDDGLVSIFVDAGAPGVDLPAHVCAEAVRVKVGQEEGGEVAVVHLHLSRAFSLPTFEVGVHEIRAALSFGSERHLCVVPWGAVLGMRPGR